MGLSELKQFFVDNEKEIIALKDSLELFVFLLHNPLMQPHTRTHTHIHTHTHTQKKLHS